VSDVDARLEQLLEQWDDLRRGGRKVSAEELTDDPQLAAALQRRIDRLAEMDWLDAVELEETVVVERGAAARPPEGSEWGFRRCVPYFLGLRYVLESLIAEGGFGQVWRAWDRTLERLVAIKLSTVDSSAEARRVAQLQHPGVVAVHDLGKEGDFWYIVFDLVEGTDLAKRIEEDPPDWRESVRIVADVACTLQYAHEKGFVHRDVKPGNILIKRNGKPILADFGIAFTEQEMRGETITTSGTLAYMAPELLEGDGKIADVCTDVYGLGVVLYQLLNHRLPFEGRSFVDVRRRILSGEPPEWDDSVARAPEALKKITLRCLAKDPDMRYQSAGELAEELKIVLASGASESSSAPAR
jgi:serine/threonine protein kinase